MAGPAAAPPHTFRRVCLQGSADFSDAGFTGDARFGEATFELGASFHGSHFHRAASFERATFQGDVNFSGSTNFDEGAQFNHATFKDDAWFGGVNFHMPASFRCARFRGRASFGEATFQSAGDFLGATFHGHTDFRATAFRGDAEFSEADFKASLDFTPSHVSRDARFTGAQFRRRGQQLGPFVAARVVMFSDATFFAPAEIDVSADVLACVATDFRAGGTVAVRHAEILLDGAQFSAPTRIASPVPTANDDDAAAGNDAGDDDAVGATLDVDDVQPHAPAPDGTADARCLANDDDTQLRRGPTARLLSVRAADVRHLVLADLDLRACRFLGAHNLRELRIEGDSRFADSAGRLYTSRRVLAEEHEWRFTRFQARERLRTDAPTSDVRDTRRRHHSPSEVWARLRHAATRRAARRWHGPVCRLPVWFTDPRPGIDPAVAPLVPPDASRISALYRDLRRGLEEARDVPGAGDFYYGEMEMRRLARPHRTRRAGPVSDRGERTILWAYWALSGYGLRSQRAFAALMVTVLVFAALFYFFGLRDPDVSQALLQSVNGAAFRTGDARRLTETGQFLTVPLRLLGPLLLGIALLAIRGRVTR